MGGTLIRRQLGTICPVWLERVVAERPKIAVTRHDNRALAAKLSGLELADIHARRREPDLRGVRTACSLDLEHADAFRDAVREFTAINIAVWETVLTNAICPGCGYIALAFLLSQFGLRKVVLEQSSVCDSGFGNQQPVAVAEAIPEAADIDSRLIPADNVVGRLPNELYLQYSKTIPVSMTKLAAVDVTVLIGIRAHAVIPLARRELPLPRE
jgi:hypothetical protein